MPPEKCCATCIETYEEGPFCGGAEVTADYVCEKWRSAPEKRPTCSEFQEKYGLSEELRNSLPETDPVKIERNMLRAENGALLRQLEIGGEKYRHLEKLLEKAENAIRVLTHTMVNCTAPLCEVCGSACRWKETLAETYTAAQEKLKNWAEKEEIRK